MLFSGFIIFGKVLIFFLIEDLVKDNEPNIALFGGDDGMKFYRIILSGVKPLLNKKAIIAFEHGYNKKDGQ